MNAIPVHSLHRLCFSCGWISPLSKINFGHVFLGRKVIFWPYHGNYTIGGNDEIYNPSFLLHSYFYPMTNGPTNFKISFLNIEFFGFEQGSTTKLKLLNKRAQLEDGIYLMNIVITFHSMATNGSQSRKIHICISGS